MKSHTKTFAILSVALLTLSNSFAGAFVHETLKLGGVTVDWSNPDPQARLQSYRSALTGAFPSIDVQSLEILDEFHDVSFGTTTVRLVQKYRGLEVLSAYTVIEISKSGTGDYAGANYYNGITLPDEGFLADKDDSAALDTFARSFWPEIASDEEVWVLPLVLPIETSTPGEYSYYYALNIASRQHGPERFYDWSTGTLLRIGERDNRIVFRTDIRHQVFDPNVEPNGAYTTVTEDCHGIGHLIDNFTDCWDPPDGNCSIDDWGTLYIRIEAATPRIPRWFRSGTDVSYYLDYEYWDEWQLLDVMWFPRHGDNYLDVTFQSGWIGGNEEDPAALFNLNNVSRFWESHFGAIRPTYAVTCDCDLDDDAVAWATREAGHNVIMFGAYPSNIPDATPAKSKDNAAKTLLWQSADSIRDIQVLPTDEFARVLDVTFMTPHSNAPGTDHTVIKRWQFDLSTLNGEWHVDHSRQRSDRADRVRCRR